MTTFASVAACAAFLATVAVCVAAAKKAIDDVGEADGIGDRSAGGRRRGARKVETDVRPAIRRNRIVETARERDPRPRVGVGKTVDEEVVLSRRRIDQQEAMRQAEWQREMSRQAEEAARLASTGIEFGGMNPDPNLNPGLSSNPFPPGNDPFFGL